MRKFQWIVVWALLLWLLAMALLWSVPADAQVEPYPTQSATSWVATPTSQPVRPCPCAVLLPMTMNGGR